MQEETKVDSNGIVQNLLENYSREYSDIEMVKENPNFTLLKGKYQKM